MKRPYQGMLAMVALGALMVLGGCGGGAGDVTQSVPQDTPLAPSESPVVGDTDGQETTADAERPAIIDVYEDHQFKYADLMLYREDEDTPRPYTLMTEVPETCSTMLGVALPTVATVDSLSETAAIVLATGESLSAPAASESDVGSYDMWGFAGIYDAKHLCAVTFSSIVTTNGGAQTLDVMGFGCGELSTQETCVALFARTAAIDFSGVAIKSAGGSEDAPMTPIEDALRALVLVAGE
jgi:hypothetical protein